MSLTMDSMFSQYLAWYQRYRTKYGSNTAVLMQVGKFYEIYDRLNLTTNSTYTNIREIEGALNTLLAHASLNKKAITLELAKQMVDKFVRSTAREVSIEYIQKVVCDYFDLPIEMLKSKTRKREVVQARQISMYFSKKMTKSSLANIGAHCGGKDHATVLHACRTVVNLSETDKQFRNYLEELEKKLTIH